MKTNKANIKVPDREGGGGVKIKLSKPWHNGSASRNRFCGPAALSAILGISCENAALRIREKSGKRSCMGTWAPELRVVLRDFGLDFVSEEEIGRVIRPTFAQWLKARSEADRCRLYMIAAGHHWIVVKGGLIVDSMQGMTIESESQHKRKRVAEVYEIRDTRPDVWLRWQARVDKEVWPTGKSPEERAAAAQGRRKTSDRLRALLKSTGAEIEGSGRYFEGCFLHLPPNRSFDGAHCRSLWSIEEGIEVLEEMEECHCGDCDPEEDLQA